MKNALIINWSPGRQIFDRLALSLYKDSMTRSLTVSGIPTALALTSDSFSGLNGRQISARYLHLVGMLRPADLKDGKMVPVTLESIVEYVSKRVRTHEEITIQLDKIFEVQSQSADAASETGKAAKVASLVGKVDQYISELWEQSGIIEFLSDAHVVMKDVSDPENAYSLRATYNEAFPQGHTADDIIKANLDGFLSGSGLANMGGSPIDKKLREKLNCFEYIYPTTTDSKYRYSPLQLATALAADGGASSEKDAGRKAIQDLICALTDFEAILSVPALRSAVDPMLDASKGDRISDNKNLNALIVEAERVKTLYELKTFISLQSWVTLMQLTFKGYLTDGSIEFAKSVLPSFAATYDITGLLSWLYELPVGTNTSALLSDITIPTSATVGNKSFEVIYNPDNQVKHEEIAADILATIKHVIPMLHSLKSNTALWEIYRKGGSFLNASSLAISSVTRNLDEIPVSYVQHGVFSGEVPRSLDDMAWTMMFDWGLNMFNSSARSLFLLRDLSSNGTLAPYAYGTINYASYSKRLRSVVSGFDKKGVMPSGVDIYKANIPAIPMKRVLRASDTLTMWIDAKVANVGPVCMLPVPPMSFSSLYETATMTSVSKERVGKYETDMESKPMTTLHVLPNKDAKKVVEGSMLNARLGISNRNFAGAIDKGDVLLGRFVSPDDPSIVSCEAITKDDVFIDAINCFYYIPLQNVDPNISLVYMSSDISMNGDAEAGVTLKSRPVDVYRIYSDPASLSVLMVQSRLLGHRLFMDDMFKGVVSEDNVTMDIQAATV